jgi:hypothetical protein
VSEQPAQPPTLLVAALAVPEARVVEVAAELPGAVVLDLFEHPLAKLDEQWASHRWRTALVVASDLAALRRGLPLLDSLGRATEVRVRLLDRTGVSSTLRTPLLGLGHGARLTRVQPCNDGMELTARAPGRLGLRGVARLLAAGSDGMPASGIRIACADSGSLAWGVDQPQSQTLAVAQRLTAGPGLAPDVLLHTAPAPPSGFKRTVPVDLGGRCPPVDAVVIRPRTDPTVGSDIGRVVSLPTGEPAIELPMGVLPWPRVPGPAEHGQLASLRHVVVTQTAPPVPEAAALVASLATAGIPVVADQLDPRLADLLHPDLRAAVRASDAADTEVPLLRAATSVRQRRAAIRRHSTAGAWRDLTQQLGLAVLPPPTVSVLFATRRPSLLESALAFIAQQREVDVEIVVVTHGFMLNRRATRRLRARCPHEVVIQPAPSHLTLGEALNVGLAAASGSVVSKMDDDDMYGPHHLEDLLQGLSVSGATIVGAASSFTYLAGADLTLQQESVPALETTTSRAPGPTLTMRRADLVHLGGFRPVPRLVDLTMNHQVQSAGGTIALTHGLGWLRCRHGRGHTWAVDPARFLESASDKWDGLVPPPEVTDVSAARRHLERLHETYDRRSRMVSLRRGDRSLATSRHAGETGT